MARVVHHAVDVAPAPAPVKLIAEGQGEEAAESAKSSGGVPAAKQAEEELEGAARGARIGEVGGQCCQCCISQRQVTPWERARLAVLERQLQHYKDMDLHGQGLASVHIDRETGPNHMQRVIHSRATKWDIQCKSLKPGDPYEVKSLGIDPFTGRPYGGRASTFILARASQKGYGMMGKKQQSRTLQRSFVTCGTCPHLQAAQLQAKKRPVINKVEIDYVAMEELRGQLGWQGTNFIKRWLHRSAPKAKCLAEKKHRQQVKGATWTYEKGISQDHAGNAVPFARVAEAHFEQCLVQLLQDMAPSMTYNPSFPHGTIPIQFLWDKGQGTCKLGIKFPFLSKANSVDSMWFVAHAAGDYEDFELYNSVFKPFFTSFNRINQGLVKVKVQMKPMLLTVPFRAKVVKHMHLLERKLEDAKCCSNSDMQCGKCTQLVLELERGFRCIEPTADGWEAAKGHDKEANEQVAQDEAQTATVPAAQGEAAVGVAAKKAEDKAAVAEQEAKVAIAEKAVEAEAKDGRVLTTVRAAKGATVKGAAPEEKSLSHGEAAKGHGKEANEQVAQDKVKTATVPAAKGEAAVGVAEEAEGVAAEAAATAARDKEAQVGAAKEEAEDKAAAAEQEAKEAIGQGAAPEEKPLSHYEVKRALKVAANNDYLQTLGLTASAKQELGTALRKRGTGQKERGIARGQRKCDTTTSQINGAAFDSKEKLLNAIRNCRHQLGVLGVSCVHVPAGRRIMGALSTEFTVLFDLLKKASPSIDAHLLTVDHTIDPPVDSLVLIWWDGDCTWYPGKVVMHSEESGHRVRFTDGDLKNMRLGAKFEKPRQPTEEELMGPNNERLMPWCFNREAAQVEQASQALQQKRELRGDCADIPNCVRVGQGPQSLQQTCGAASAVVQPIQTSQMRKQYKQRVALLHDLAAQTKGAAAQLGELQGVMVAKAGGDAPWVQVHGCPRGHARYHLGMDVEVYWVETPGRKCGWYTGKVDRIDHEGIHVYYEGEDTFSVHALLSHVLQPDSGRPKFRVGDHVVVKGAPNQARRNGTITDVSPTEIRVSYERLESGETNYAHNDIRVEPIIVAAEGANADVALVVAAEGAKADEGVILADQAVAAAAAWELYEEGKGALAAAEAACLAARSAHKVSKHAHWRVHVEGDQSAPGVLKAAQLAATAAADQAQAQVRLAQAAAQAATTAWRQRQHGTTTGVLSRCHYMLFKGKRRLFKRWTRVNSTKHGSKQQRQEALLRAINRTVATSPLDYHLDHKNQTLSDCCATCKNSDPSHIMDCFESWNATYSPEPTECVVCATAGSDCAGFCAVLQRAGIGSADACCLVCAASCSSRKASAGGPQACNVQPHYQHLDHRLPIVRNPPLITQQSIDYNVAQHQDELDDYQICVESGGLKCPKTTHKCGHVCTAPSHFGGCKGHPLLHGDALNWFSGSELHVTQGCTMAIEKHLRRIIRKIDRPMMELDKPSNVQVLESQLEDLHAVAASHKQQLETLEAKSKHISQAQSKRDDAQQPIQQIEKEMAKGHANLLQSEKELKQKLKELEAYDGPVMHEYKSICQALHLERQVYHSGALNGRDCAKFLLRENIRLFMEILKPRRLVNGTWQGKQNKHRRRINKMVADYETKQYRQQAVAEALTGGKMVVDSESSAADADAKSNVVLVMGCNPGFRRHHVHNFLLSGDSTTVIHTGCGIRHARAIAAAYHKPLIQAVACGQGKVAYVKLTKSRNFGELEHNIVAEHGTCNFPAPKVDESKAQMGGDELALKAYQMFSKFSQLRELYRRKSCLCKHEVVLHRMRADSFGNWFPINFPDSTLSTESAKFHIAIVEHPRIISKYYTVGAFTEEVIESTHQKESRLARLTRSIANPETRMEAVLVNSQHRLMGQCAKLKTAEVTAAMKEARRSCSKNRRI